MNILLHVHDCKRGQCLPLLPVAATDSDFCRSHGLMTPEPWAMPHLRVGTCFCGACGTALLKVTGRAWIPLLPNVANPGGNGEEPWQASHAVQCLLLTALTDLPEGPLEVTARKTGYSLAWITLSDKGARGQRLDLSGPAIAEMVGSAMPLSHSQGFLLPDEAAQLRALLTELALSQGFDLICTTGGTGLSARDITPQTTAALLDTPLPGFTQAMLAASLAKTPHAVISRAAAGTLGQSIIINLPGSRKAVVENLAAVLPALPHALAKLQGDPADCGG
ncbi:MogA/MoaB family molybdenum cofactor biosynthesis protein [Desulfovibrio desulfuricans]|uniref:MogA/MoaB family molybdenum cofactor biosynthesis protein n=1 Tax=Desulfovibrio desulfuricans TaxID=876 RepID=UPI001AE71A32|nr:MogA/MoaB family molybdenum cofactor biosynthesis protein [Desulfovibrio desulfuricans]QTO41072.1 MogA/MoaB family molybdenum cofactor biosynthesis protein [Desulfovibrio desulfuricans]